jgi:hypothetical protein
VITTTVINALPQSRRAANTPGRTRSTSWAVAGGSPPVRAFRPLDPGGAEGNPNGPRPTGRYWNPRGSLDRRFSLTQIYSAWNRDRMFFIRDQEFLLNSPSLMGNTVIEGSTHKLESCYRGAVINKASVLRASCCSMKHDVAPLQRRSENSI